MQITKERYIMTTNIFNSWIDRDIFVGNIIEKVTLDWMNSSNKRDISKDGLRDFFYEEFQEWICMELEAWLDEEFDDFVNDDDEEDD